MESSSDESFAWTHTSNDSDEESITLSPEMHTTSNSYSENNDTVSTEKKSKKRKQRNSSIAEEELESPKKKKIKIEDLDVSKESKKKKKHKEYDEKDLDSSKYDTYDYDYLNMKVKQEQDSFKQFEEKKSKKSKKKHSESHIDSDVNTDELDKLVKEERKTKKKKKKHSYKEGEDELSETTMEELNQSLSFKNSQISEYNVSLGQEHPPRKSVSFQVNGDVNDSYQNANHLNGISNGIEEELSDQLQQDKEAESIDNYNSINNLSHQKKSTKKSGRTSDLDKIRFEHTSDGNDSEIDVSTTSRGLKNFLKQNVTLQPISESLDHLPQITSNDEIWLLKCPNEVDLNNLNNTDILLDLKAKLKVNGESYHGTLNEENNSITVMTAKRSKLIIKSVKLKGTVSFRKRMPKPHFVDDNVMVNNQTDFIPLPETKCRHPLFGSNYKNAIKIPHPIVQRLNNSDTELMNTSSSERKKKKKHKKEYTEDTELEESIDEKPLKEELVEDTPVKKSKKRKNHEDDTHVKKSKRVKKEYESEVWESEKAIEEELFNF